MYDVNAIIAEPLLFDPVRQSVEVEAPPAYLRSVKIKLTARCNLRCKMCKYGRGKRPPQMPSERFLTLMPELAELGARKVHFSGGEVFLRRRFEDIVGVSADAGLKVTLTSNLTLVTKERAKGLMRHRVNSISTSLDGARSRVHDQVRGMDGAFKKTLAAIGWLARERERRGQRTRLRVNHVLLRDNYREYPALVRLCAELGVTELHPMPVDGDPKLRLGKQQLRRYNEEIAPRVAEERQKAGYSMLERYIYPFGRSKFALDESTEGRYAGGYYRDKLCYAPYLHMFVRWNGEVYLCCMTNGRMPPLGDLSTASAREVFLGPRFQQVRADMKRARLPSCHNCDMYLEENQALAKALGERPQPPAVDLARPRTAPPSPGRLPVLS